MALDPEELEALKAEDGYIIDLDGEEVPVGHDFDYSALSDVFDGLVEERGGEGAAKALGFDDGKDMVLYMAEYFDHEDYYMDDLVRECCHGKSANGYDPEAEYADHELDRRLGK